MYKDMGYHFRALRDDTVAAGKDLLLFLCRPSFKQNKTKQNENEKKRLLEAFQREARG